MKNSSYPHQHKTKPAQVVDTGINEVIDEFTSTPFKK